MRLVGTERSGESVPLPAVLAEQTAFILAGLPKRRRAG
jgi:hypothetical protein